MSHLHRVKSIAGDQDGVAAVEFAIVLPVLGLMLTAIFDLGYALYMQSIVNGGVQIAARAATLETGAAELADINSLLEEKIKYINAEADVKFEQKSYFDFNDVAQAEVFTDTVIDGVKNGVYDFGECFEDVNGNAVWDADIGADGIGGPRDIVQYTVTVTYDSFFPLWKFIGGSQKKEASATTVLQNQPFGSKQDAISSKVICT